ncbi:osmoprotectant transport system substrate-binding protein [Anaerobranca californiensis DSM 14826]|jgi:glycine betaine/choline ABC-type transport system substrate-binding protein|uniref:Osmoprotectant transport system substrate-binding protein n=1 Tax=Anaerobranca californiensis DSM 14826 TaxID=1120989 RepID=A0A1M6S1J5_9FIRM|nr:glycine betaine ABC transporter substrate-binding protein [Anaerobranca californiensis]SHK38555.1 osmoprotectant transport system substrate-binding protein [Anaerobranca californiensis DSM 14826]
MFKKKIIVPILLIGIILLSVGCSTQKEGIAIGGKDFTEQDILVYIIGELIENNTDIPVRYRNYLGGTNIVDGAIRRGDLDIYVEYTGTAYINLLGLEPINDSQRVYEIVAQEYAEKFNIKWLKPLGFNNTYTLAMRRAHAEELGIEKISDLVPFAQDLTLGATHEFLERKDGYLGLQEVYGITFGDTRGLDPGLTYAAVRDGAVDVNDAFSTDGRIVAFDLKVLEDDKNFFPPYYAVPIIRMDTLEKYPQLEEIINKLAGRLTDEIMQKLNAKVDLDGENARDVARNWLKSEGLIK